MLVSRLMMNQTTWMMAGMLKMIIRIRKENNFSSGVCITLAPSVFLNQIIVAPMIKLISQNKLAPHQNNHFLLI